MYLKLITFLFFYKLLINKFLKLIFIKLFKKKKKESVFGSKI